jgi:DMSO/TMAO reductase YedYZ molybdopterin-dependent catalytic subunit
LPVRLPPAASWTIRLHGLVEAPLEIPIEELRREATDRGLHLLECAGNSRNAHFGLMSCARFRGVSLERVLRRVRIRPGGTQVLVSGFDEHDTLDPGSVAGASWIFTPDQLLEAGAFLATEMNGAPLRPDHGHPVRLVVPGWYACAAIKWVNEIVVVDDTALPTTHMLEYAGRTHQDPSGPPLARDFAPATVDPAAAAVRVEKLGEPRGAVSYRVVGLLWGAPRPRSLRIRLGPDRGFEPVEKVVDDATAPWTLWSYTVPTLPPGRHRIELAANDPALRTRRLDQGFYAREIEIAAD